MEYYTMTTNAGDESVANSILTGIKTTFKQLAVGDGNGSYYEPAKTQNALRREVWRGDAAVSIDPTNPKRVIIMATIPATVGGFTVREAGVFDTANTLMVISKLPLSEKVSPDSGASTDLVIRIYFEVSDVNAVTITVDPSAVMATKSDVNAVAENLDEHKADSSAHISTATHTKIDTTHNLEVETGAKNIEFLAAANIDDGDAWMVNGNPVTTTLQNGDPLPSDLFKPGNWVTSVRLDGTKLGFKAAGGGTSLNIFCQPELPIDEFDGIALLTNEKIIPKKVVFDTSVWAAQGWKVPSGVQNMAAARQGAASCVYNNEVYLFGGKTQVNDAETFLKSAVAYNPATNTYRALADMPTPKYGGACILYQGKIHIVGGQYGSGNYTSYIYVYDPATDTYVDHSYSSVVAGIHAFASTVYNGKLYLFGGYVNTSTQNKNMFMYDPETIAFTMLAALVSTNPPISATMCAYDNKIFIFGGYASPSGGLYDITANTFTNEFNLPGITSRPAQAASIVVNNEMFIFGGHDYTTVLNTMYAYNFVTRTFRTLPNMPAIHSDAAIAQVGNLIMLFGGTLDNDSNSVAYVDCMSLVAKQYQDNPTVAIYYLPKDTSLVTSLLATKLIDYLPSYFRDVMLFKDGVITFPALYIGNGTSWIKIRDTIN